MGIGPVDDAGEADVAETARAALDRAAGRAEAFAVVQRELIAELIELWPVAGWRVAGVRSAKDWLLAYTPLSFHEAHRLEKVAELCARDARLADAVVSGELAVKRAWTLARLVTPTRARFLDEVIEPLLQLNAGTGDDEDFAAAVRFWAERVDEELPPRAEARHWLALTPSLFGGGDINGTLSPSAYANVSSAVDGWTQDPDPADAPYQRTLRERQADALDDLCAASLTGAGIEPDHGDQLSDDELETVATDTYDGWSDVDELSDHDDLDAQLDHDGCTGCDDCHDGVLDDLAAMRRRLRWAERCRRRRLRRRMKIRSGATVNTHVDVRTLLGLRDRTDLEGLVARGDGFTLTRGVLERMVCDAGLLVTLFDGKNSLIDANARSEHFTPAQRRAIAARDRCCVFPGCRRPPRHCDIHHLVERSRGGPSKVSNGALLCRFHHRLVHDHRWQVLIEDDQWIAIDRHGRRWTGRPAPPAAAAAA